MARISARFSEPLARRGLRPNQDKVRSTTQRPGSTTKPLMSSVRLQKAAGHRDPSTTKLCAGENARAPAIQTATMAISSANSTILRTRLRL